MLNFLRDMFHVTKMIVVAFIIIFGVAALMWGCMFVLGLLSIWASAPILIFAFIAVITLFWRSTY